ncbi:MAG: capsule assembly Wzi family protein [candidate division KSB1 bacterium]|nr:capsule assembly Wzi family protein [candidate division KSB1 bacterium]
MTRHVVVSSFLLAIHLPLLAQTSLSSNEIREAANSPAVSATVPLEHPVYPFLEKIGALLPPHALDLHVLPLDRHQVLKILSDAKANEAPLSRADQALLQQYLAEFTDPKIGEVAHPGAERHVMRYEEAGAQIFADLFASQRFEFRRGDWETGEADLSRTRVGARVRARFGSRLLAAVDFSNILERGANDTSESFTPGLGSPVTRSGESAFRESAVAYFRFHLPWFEIELGRNHSAWNISPLSQITLSQQNQPVDFVKIDSRWEKFRFVFFHANLRSANQKFLATHRLEIMPHPRWSVGIGESVIYGNRGPEFLYLNPIMLYHAAEHLLGDRDNNVLTIDFTIFPFRGAKFYAEIFIDDLSLEFPLGTYWGNKLAYLGGFYWAQPLGWRSGEFRFEYTRIDPFVYTHDDSINVYEQDGEGLGERFGPNAHRFALHAAFQPHRDLRVVSQIAYQRKGQGDIFTPHRPEDGEAKGFLSGTTINSTFWQVEVEDQLFRDVYLKLELAWEWRQHDNFVPGLKARQRLAAFAVRADF